MVKMNKKWYFITAKRCGDCALQFFARTPEGLRRILDRLANGDWENVMIEVYG